MVLDVNQKWGLTESVQRTMAWYKAQHKGADDVRSLCDAEIADFEALV